MGYAWIIDTDHLFEPGDSGATDEAGTSGPSDASDSDMARLDAGEGFHFRMYDDDRILYYSGRLVVSGDTTREEVMFAPLDDFGKPNAGATDIRWAWDRWRSA